MSLALAVFGTPNGFNFKAEGDKSLVSSNLASQFEALSFSKIGLRDGDTVWGLFKRIDAKDTIIGVCKLIGAREHSSQRPGCYIGAGFIFRNQFAPYDDLFTAIQELMDAVVTTAFAEKSFKFLSPEISDSLPDSIPESCQDLQNKLSGILETDLYAAEGPASPLYIRGERTEVLRKVLMEQDKFASLNIIFSHDQDFSQKAEFGGLNVMDVTKFEKLALEAKNKIDMKQQRDLQVQKSQRNQSDVYANAQSRREQPAVRRASATDQMASFSDHGPPAKKSGSKTPNGLLSSAKSWFDSNRVLVLFMSVLLTAVISVLGTYIGVLELRYWDDSMRVEKLSDEIKNEIKKLHESNQQLTNEVKSLRKEYGTGKKSTPQSGQASESERAKTPPSPSPGAKRKQGSSAATSAQEGSAKNKNDSSPPNQEGTNN
jgi:hypothetical protein